jgi:hypothetical protein
MESFTDCSNRVRAGKKLVAYFVGTAGGGLVGSSAMFDARMFSSVCGGRGTSERVLLMKKVVGGWWTEEASAQTIKTGAPKAKAWLCTLALALALVYRVK